MPFHIIQSPAPSKNWIMPFGDYTHSITGGFGTRQLTVMDCSSLSTFRTRVTEEVNPRAPFVMFRGDGVAVIEPKPITLLVRGTTERDARAQLAATFKDMRDASYFRVDDTEIQWWLQGYNLAMSDWQLNPFNKSLTWWQVEAELQLIDPQPTIGYTNPTRDFRGITLPAQPLAQYEAVTPTGNYLLTVEDSERGTTGSFATIVQPPGSITGFPTRDAPPRVTKLSLAHLAQETSEARAILRPFMLFQVLRHATQIRTYPESSVLAELPGNGQSVASITTDTRAGNNNRFARIDIEFNVKRIPAFAFTFGLISQGYGLKSQGYRLVQRRR